LIRVIAILLCLTCPLRAEVYPALHDVTGVAAGDVLDILDLPSGDAQIIGTLAPDATGVEVVAVQDGWAVVNAEDRSGYVELGKLVRAAGPDWNALETPITCLGTEPFWSLRIDTVAGMAEYLTPEMPEPKQSAMTETWPGAPYAPAAAVGLPEGLAVLQPLECSDGMSERSYGIAVDIFLRGQGNAERTRLSGCCRLSPP
jgi:uncharacterized membrane protein